MACRPGYRLSLQDRLDNTLVHLPRAAPDTTRRKRTHSELQVGEDRTHKRPETRGLSITSNDTPARSALNESPSAREKLIIDLSPIEPVLKHPATVALAKKLGTSILELFGYLFLTSHPYDNIYLSIDKKLTLRKPDRYGTFHTRAELHSLIHTYILKRGACITLIEAEGYRINGNYASKTDPAFVAFIGALISNEEGTVKTNCNLAEDTCWIPDYGRTVIVNEQRLVEAFRVFTREPMKFRVQKLINHRLTTEMNVVVWFEDVEPKGYWNTTWKVMRKPYANCVAPDENYRFERLPDA